MPNRILKESICTSETINSLTPFQEIFFYRLIVNCDDFGMMDARPAILKAKLFPLKEKVTLKDVEGALKALAACKCVELYEVEHRPYLRLPTWGVHQRIRNKKSKYPLPLMESDGNMTLDFDNKVQSKSNCCQMTADCIKSRPESNPIRIQSESNPNPNARDSALRDFDGDLRSKLEEWLQYKAERQEFYKSTGLRSFISEVKKRQKQCTDGEICDLIDFCMSNGWKGIIWDKLSAEKNKPVKSRVADTAGSSIDKNKLDEFIDSQFDLE